MTDGMNRPPVLFAAPHRLPFLTGSLGLSSAAGWWLFQIYGIHVAPGSGLTGELPALLLHGATMIYLGFAPFIFGFLLTVFPRWMGYPDMAPRQYGPVAGLLALGVATGHAGLWLATAVPLLAGLALLGLGWLLALLRLGRIERQNRNDGKPVNWHAVSALSALLFGVAALGLVILFLVQGDPRVLRWSNQIAINLFLLPVFLTVAHRMVPFFAGNVVQNYQRWRPEWLVPALWALLLVRMLGTGLLLDPVAGAASAGLAALTGLMAWKWWPRGPAPGLLNVLMWGFAWAPAGFLLSAMAAAGLPLGLAPTHALMIGFAASLLVAMVTRVTQGHSGRPLAMFGLAWIAFAAIQLAALLRIWAALRHEDGPILFAAALALLAGTLPWLLRNAAVYLAPRKDGKPG